MTPRSRTSNRHRVRRHPTAGSMRRYWLNLTEMSPETVYDFIYFQRLPFGLFEFEDL